MGISNNNFLRCDLSKSISLNPIINQKNFGYILDQSKKDHVMNNMKKRVIISKQKLLNPQYHNLNYHSFIESINLQKFQENNGRQYQDSNKIEDKTIENRKYIINLEEIQGIDQGIK